jgi:hypothetical protein
MIYERDTVLKDLRENAMAIYFTDTTGNKHEIRCTLMPSLLPKTYLNEMAEERKYHEDNPNMIAAWNIMKNMWINFDISHVDYVQILDSLQY